jgi:hypothetical protein
MDAPSSSSPAPFWKRWAFWRSVLWAAVPIAAIVCPLFPGTGGVVCRTAAAVLRTFEQGPALQQLEQLTPDAGVTR